MPTPSYHDLHITTEKMERISIFNLPFQYRVECCRVSGWQLLYMRHHHSYIPGEDKFEVVAGEYGGDGKGLRLDVSGYLICDSLTKDGDTE